MNSRTTLTITSLLSLVLFSFHLADDIVRGIEKGTWDDLGAFVIFFVWICGTLLLRERRSGYVIMLLGSLLSAAVPILHMSGNGIGVNSRIGGTPNAFFFVWTLLAMGITGPLGVVLSLRLLWGSFGRGKEVTA
jgi:hypothetical protein